MAEGACALVARGGATPSRGGPLSFWSKVAAAFSPYKTIDYETLPGLAREAADYALAGQVPTKTKEGLALATFAGGCFWQCRN